MTPVEDVKHINLKEAIGSIFRHSPAPLDVKVKAGLLLFHNTVSQQFARDNGVSKEHFSRVLHGVRESPRLWKLMCRALYCELDDLLLPEGVKPVALSHLLGSSSLPGAGVNGIENRAPELSR